MKLTAQAAARYGFAFSGHRGWITPADMPRITQDAALATMPNAAVPADLLSYIDPTVIEILTQPLMAREVFTEVKKGDWTTSMARFRAKEVTGRTESYSDFAHSGAAGVNNNWILRENYLFQTFIRVGDLEADVSAEAKINLLADKQQAAARVIDIDGNKFYLYGVAGKQIYGLLNDPSLSAPTTPLPVGTGNSPLWKNKTTVQIYEDVLALFQELVKQCPYTNEKTKLKLILSPSLNVLLGKSTDFNISVKKMLADYFSNLTFITMPEMAGASTGETMMLLADEVLGQRTGELGFSEKIRTFPAVRKESSIVQKWASGTEGAIIYLPFAIVQMRGM